MGFNSAVIILAQKYEMFHVQNDFFVFFFFFYNLKDSLGAISYFCQRKEGNLMIDCPRYDSVYATLIKE